MVNKKEIIRLILFSIIMGPISLALLIGIDAVTTIHRGSEDLVTIILVVIFAVPISLYSAKSKRAVIKSCYFVISALIIFIVHYISFFGFIFLFWPTW